MGTTTTCDTAHCSSLMDILPDLATPAIKTLWEEYVDAYHDFWNYLEQHEELLERESDVYWLSNVTKVCRIMEECPVVNFSCVRDLI